MTYRRALQTYQRIQQTAMSPRYMEKAAFARAVSMLKQAQERIDDDEAYRAALKFNQKLWTYIQSRLAGNDHGVPSDARTNLLALSVFIDRYTFSALAKPETDNLAPLIDINVKISRGLDSGPTVRTDTADERVSVNGFRPN